MKSFKSFSKRLTKSESGQGATEYILLLVVVVSLVLLFKDNIKDTLNTKLGELKGSISSFTVQ